MERISRSRSNQTNRAVRAKQPNYPVAACNLAAGEADIYAGDGKRRRGQTPVKLRIVLAAATGDEPIYYRPIPQDTRAYSAATNSGTAWNKSATRP